MVVSHYLVSWIQVGGLIVGLYGFFFLAVSLFGRKSIPWFRALLPASGAALGVLLVLSSIETIRKGNTSVHLSQFDWFDWSIVLATFVFIYLLSGYMGWAVSSARSSPEVITMLKGDTKIWKISAATISILLLIGSVAGYLIFPNHIPISLYVFFNMGSLAFLWATVLVIILPQTMEERGLLAIGFVLSLFAILTQFIPPVLDLLGIAVK